MASRDPRETDPPTAAAVMLFLPEAPPEAAAAIQSLLDVLGPPRTAEDDLVERLGEPSPPTCRLCGTTLEPCEAQETFTSADGSTRCVAWARRRAREG